MARIDIHASLLVLLGALTTGCTTRIGEHHYFHRAEQPHAAAWGYSGETGPAHWADLDPSYALARKGRKQSPIDLGAAQLTEVPQLRFDYKPATVRVVYNGHTIEEEDVEASSIWVANRRFGLKQFHFHAPSEHTVAGEQFPMEMHLVHKNEAGAVAVVGVLIREGPENAAFRPVWDNLPSPAATQRTSDVKVDVGALLPTDHSSFRYEGSFTTPPCTEGVEWIVLRTPVSLSAAQIAAFRAIIDGNNRPVQPLHGRKVLRSGS